MFKKTFLTAGIAAAFTLSSASAMAALYLDTPGQSGTEQDYVQRLEDTFLEVLIRNGQVLTVDQNTVIQQGDLFAGVQSMQKTERVDPADGPPLDVFSLQDTQTFTALFLTDVASVTPDVPNDIPDRGDVLTFGAVGAATWEAVFGSGGLIDVSAEFDIADLDQDGSNGTTPVSVGTTALLLWGADDAQLDSTGTANGGSGTLSESAETYVKDAILQYEFGFTGVNGTPGTDEFWLTYGNNALSPALVASTQPNVKAALNITQQWAGPDLTPHDYRKSAQFDADFTGKTHLQINGNVTAVANGTPWSVSGDADDYIKPVIPEPATTGLLALGLLGMGLAGRRRKTA